MHSIIPLHSIHLFISHYLQMLHQFRCDAESNREIINVSIDLSGHSAVYRYFNSIFDVATHHHQQYVRKQS